MHILFLSAEYPLWASGGVGTFIQTLGRALVKKGHKVTVMGPGKEKEELYLEDEGVQLYRLPKNQGKLPDFVHNARQLNKKIRSLHKANPIDVMESPEGGLAFISRAHSIKKVIRLHGGHHFFAEAERRGINWRKALLEKRSFRKTNGFIAVSKYVKDHTSKYLSYHGKPIEIIKNPVATQVVIPEVSVDPNRILFAGTVCEKKGVRELIQAFRIVKKNYPEKELHLFGRDWFFPNGDSYIEMLKKTFDPTYFEGVVFHGAIPRKDLDTEYAKASLCVFPSHMETQGLVSLEAMLLEKPVVFSKYGPGPETIEHLKTGLLSDVYDVSDLAAQMIWCIEHPKEASEMGKRAREVVLANYNEGLILEQTLSFYESL